MRQRAVVSSSLPPATADSAPRFAVGDAVRVKKGIKDPDYPDIPLGGWAGVIVDMDDNEDKRLYRIRWSEETLAQVHPVYRRRCERDELEYELTWLREAELEPDTGTSLDLEQPTQLQPAPLNLEDPLDRARMLLGLTSDDELPAVDPASLEQFHQILSERVHFPITAQTSNHRPVLVRRLMPWRGEAPLDELYAECVGDNENEIELIPLANIYIPEGTLGRREIEAYICWLGADSLDPASLSSNLLVRTALLTILATALVGAALATLEEALLAVQVGAVVLGLAGAFIGSGGESLLRRAMRLPPGLFGGLLLGVLIGAVIGAALGTFLVCYVGAIPGAILGTVSARWLRTSSLRSSLALAWIGGLAYLFTIDSWAATWGALRGLLVGLALCVVVYLGFLVYLNLILNQSDSE